MKKKTQKIQTNKSLIARQKKTELKLIKLSGLFCGLNGDVFIIYMIIAFDSLRRQSFYNLAKEIKLIGG